MICKPYNVLALFFFLLLLGTPASGAEKFRDKNFISQKYSNKKITVRQMLPDNPRITGTLPALPDARPTAERFFAAISKLPENFIKRSGVRYVTVLDQLKLNGVPAGGVASGDSIYLMPNASARTVYHEFFHIFDPESKDKKWNRLNPRKFVYNGNVFHEARRPGKKRKSSKREFAEVNYKNDFVSNYAMSEEREDRAETFAAMMTEGKGFLRRTEKSSVMKKKMEYIIELTGKRKLMGREFWQKHLGLPEKK